MNRRLAAVLTLTLGVVLAGAAHAESGSVTRDGKTLSVSKVTGLLVDGEKVRVRGQGYDRNKGIYVAFCVDNGPGQVPTPCGGGADTEGSSGNSIWISDLPPAYGTGLARPYGDGGSFDVEINVKAQLNEETDCRKVRCAVVTRNDHTRSDDRSQDVLVPIRFTAPTTNGPAGPQPSRSGASTSAAPATTSPAAPRTPLSTGTPVSASPGVTASPAASGSPVRTTTEQPLAASSDSDVALTQDLASGDGGSGAAVWLGALVGVAIAMSAAWRARRRFARNRPLTDGA